MVLSTRRIPLGCTPGIFIDKLASTAGTEVIAQGSPMVAPGLFPVLGYVRTMAMGAFDFYGC